MKRFLSALLALAMVFTMTTAALAADTVDSRLQEVTRTVKATLGIGDEYTSFYGAPTEESVTGTNWNLEWAADGATLSVMANQDGKIMNYYRWEQEEDTSYDGSFAPKFPSLTRAEAKKTAQAFTARLAGAGETFVFQDDARSESVRSASRYHFSGNVHINGLPSPIGFSVSVNTADNSVRSFSRDDAYTKFYGTAPSATPAQAAPAAAALLKGAMALKLEYVLEEGSDTARLRYLPVYTGSFYVDAQTGQLVNLDEVYSSLFSGDEDKVMMNTAAEAPAEAAEDSGGAALSAAELAGIEKMEGVLAKEVLEAKARAYKEFGFDGYTLARTNYSLDRETEKVTCTLLFTKKDSNGTHRKYVTLDGKSGALEGLSTSHPYDEKAETLFDSAASRKRAEMFLLSYYKDTFEQTALYENEPVYRPYAVNDETQAHFTFAQSVDGIFFPQNRIDVSVYPVDGSIDSFSMHFDAQPKFDSQGGILSQDAAMDAYFAAFSTQLEYLNVPRAVDETMPEYQAYLDMGCSYVYELKLAYRAQSSKYCSGVDAKTGECIYPAAGAQDEGLSYTDLGGRYPEIEALADYGIGYRSSTFQPERQLTQKDMLILFLSADGWVYDETDETSLDSLYSRAYDLGILKRAERAPDKRMTRAEVVRAIVTMSGYGKTADLPGIYVCKFTDAASIRPADLGYVAIAQGLGVVNGDERGRFLPNDVATRAEAAIMLYNFMSRKV